MIVSDFDERRVVSNLILSYRAPTAAAASALQPYHPSSSAPPSDTAAFPTGHAIPTSSSSSTSTGTETEGEETVEQPDNVSVYTHQNENGRRSERYLHATATSVDEDIHRDDEPPHYDGDVYEMASCLTHYNNAAGSGGGGRSDVGSSYSSASSSSLVLKKEVDGGVPGGRRKNMSSIIYNPAMYDARNHFNVDYFVRDRQQYRHRQQGRNELVEQEAEEEQARQWQLQQQQQEQQQEPDDDQRARMKIIGGEEGTHGHGEQGVVNKSGAAGGGDGDVHEGELNGLLEEDETEEGDGDGDDSYFNSTAKEQQRQGVSKEILLSQEQQQPQPQPERQHPAVKVYNNSCVRYSNISQHFGIGVPLLEGPVRGLHDHSQLHDLAGMGMIEGGAGGDGSGAFGGGNQPFHWGSRDNSGSLVDTSMQEGEPTTTAPRSNSVDGDDSDTVDSPLIIKAVGSRRHTSTTRSKEDDEENERVIRTDQGGRDRKENEKDNDNSNNNTKKIDEDDVMMMKKKKERDLLQLREQYTTYKSFYSVLPRYFELEDGLNEDFYFCCDGLEEERADDAMREVLRKEKGAFLTMKKKKKTEIGQGYMEEEKVEEEAEEDVRHDRHRDTLKQLLRIRNPNSHDGLPPSPIPPGSPFKKHKVQPTSMTSNNIVNARRRQQQQQQMVLLAKLTQYDRYEDMTIPNSDRRNLTPNNHYPNPNHRRGPGSEEGGGGGGTGGSTTAEILSQLEARGIVGKKQEERRRREALRQKQREATDGRKEEGDESKASKDTKRGEISNRIESFDRHQTAINETARERALDAGREWLATVELPQLAQRRTERWKELRGDPRSKLVVLNDNSEEPSPPDAAQSGVVNVVSVCRRLPLLNVTHTHRQQQHIYHHSHSPPSASSVLLKATGGAGAVPIPTPPSASTSSSSSTSMKPQTTTTTSVTISSHAGTATASVTDGAAVAAGRTTQLTRYSAEHQNPFEDRQPTFVSTPWRIRHYDDFDDRMKAAMIEEGGKKRRKEKEEQDERGVQTTGTGGRGVREKDDRQDGNHHTGKDNNDPHDDKDKGISSVTTRSRRAYNYYSSEFKHQSDSVSDTANKGGGAGGALSRAGAPQTARRIDGNTTAATAMGSGVKTTHLQRGLLAPIGLVSGYSEAAAFDNEAFPGQEGSPLRDLVLHQRKNNSSSSNSKNKKGSEAKDPLLPLVGGDGSELSDLDDGDGFSPLLPGGYDHNSKAYGDADSLAKSTKKRFVRSTHYPVGISMDEAVRRKKKQHRTALQRWTHQLGLPVPGTPVKNYQVEAAVESPLTELSLYDEDEDDLLSPLI